MKQIIGITVLLTFSSLVYATQFISNPWKDAEASSKSYAEGDTYDSRGWKGCSEALGYTEQEPKIECNGQRTILFHGGKKITEDFVCSYEYSFVSESQGYKVLMSDCE